MDAKSLRAKASVVFVAVAAIMAALMIASVGSLQAAQADEVDAQAASGWTPSGSCEWQLGTASNAMTIRVANGASTGVLEDTPWKDVASTVRSITFEGSHAIAFDGDTSQFFADCTALEQLDLAGLDTSNMTEMDRMFENCSSLTELDLSMFDTSRVTDMMIMFSGCSSLERLDVSSFNTSQVQYMNNMFYGCTALQTLDITNFDTSKVVNMSIMFRDCSSLRTLDLSHFSTASASSFEEFFGGCSSLTSVDLSSFDTRNAVSFWAMFSRCASLKEVDLTPLNTSKANTISAMFQGCTALERVDFSGLDTSNMDSMDILFLDCPSLRTLDISSFNTSKVVSSADMFPVNLEELTIGAAFTLQSDIPQGSWRNRPGVSFVAADIPQGVADTYTRQVTPPTSPTVKIQAPSSTLVMPGNTLQLTAVATPAGAGALSWSSSDTSIASVDSQGLVTAVAPGTATIKVQMGSAQDSITITVGQRVQSIQLSDTAKTVLVTDAPFALTATVPPAGAVNNAVVWSTSDASVATVTPAGIVTPVAAGSAVITASAGGLTAQCAVTVQAAGNTPAPNPPTPPATSISLNHQAKAMTVGDAPFALVATVTSADGSEEVSWESSDPRVATVDAGGMVRPLRAGRTSIMATAGSAHQACAVTVDAKSVETSAASDMDGHLVISDSAVAAELAGLQLQINDSSREHDQALIQAVSKSAPAGSVYVGAFEVDMTDGAGAVHPWSSDAGSVQVHISLPEEMAAIAQAYDLSIHYVAEDAQSTEAKTTWMEEGSLVFETSHFSTYALAATPRTDGQGPVQNNTNVGGGPTGGSGLAQTGDANARILFALFSLALAGAAAAGAARLFGMRGKRS